MAISNSKLQNFITERNLYQSMFEIHTFGEK